MAATIADRMSAQHQAIDASLGAAAHLLDNGRLADAALALDDLAAALRHHIRLEEDQLFPAYARAPSADLALLATMHRQHAEIDALVTAMIDATRAREHGAALQAKAALHTALGIHDDEEELLCAALDRLLDDAPRATLIAALAR